MTYRFRIGIIALAGLANIALLSAQDARDSKVTQPRTVTPSEFLAKDTASSLGRDAVPGAILTQITSLQDTLFHRAMLMNVAANVRFADAARSLQVAIKTHKAVTPEPTPWELALRTMNIPSAFLQPSAVEVTQHRIGMANSMYVPGVLLWPMGTGNLQIPLQDIYRFFGLVEDVSPKLVYDVDETIYVEIVVYSTQARVVATIFRGVQGPGRYEITWNGHDDNKRAVASGDYIAEIRFGNERLSRKRIIWPPAK